MLLTISTTHRPATDLGYLLHKHPGKVQSFDLPVGVAHVFYPEATDERCTVALLLEVDPIGLVRGKRFGGNDALASQYASSQYGSGPWMVSFGYSEWDPVTSTSTPIGGPDFRSAVLSGASFDSVNMDQGDFNGATTTGLTSGNDPYGSSWRQTVFGPGWTSSTWTGSHDFTDATCPDGSTGSYATPCF